MVSKIVVALTATFLMGQVVSAANYTASTPAQVFENIPKLNAGDSLILANGTFKFGKDEIVRINRSGERGKRIFIGAKGSDRAVFDFSAHPLEGAHQGVIIYGTWLHLKNIDISNAGDNGMLIEDTLIFAWGQNGGKGKKWPNEMTGKSGSYNLLENLRFIKNRDSGLQLKNGASFDTIINCDGIENYDPTDGGDADGFAPKLNFGPGNYFYGCRAYYNSDDGWDCFIKLDSDRPWCPVPVGLTVEYCITYSNGRLSDGTTKGNGNGFKMSSKDGENSFDAIHSLAYSNKGGSSGNKGFDANNGSGVFTMINCSAAENGGAEYSFPTGKATMTNCNSIGSGSKEIIGGAATTCDWTGTTADFANMDASNIVADRNPDGSLSSKTLSFMSPKSGSTKFIDKGTNQSGMPTSGSKADIGWIEVGLELSPRGPLNDYPVGIKVSRNEISSTRFITGYSMADGKLNLNLTYLPSGKLDVAIFDITGKKVMDLSNTFGAAGKSQTIDMSSFSAGTYVCNFTFTSFEGVRTDNVKLIKE